MLTRGSLSASSAGNTPTRQRGLRKDDDIYDYSVGKRTQSDAESAQKKYISKKSTSKKGSLEETNSSKLRDVPPPTKRSRTGRFEKNIEVNMSDWSSDKKVPSVLSGESREAKAFSSTNEYSGSAQVVPVEKKRPGKRKKYKSQNDQVIKDVDIISIKETPSRSSSASEKQHLFSPVGTLEWSGKGASSSSSTQDNTDLGPPMPPLTVQTDFKTKKGIAYDNSSCSSSMVTPSKETGRFKSCLLEFDDRTSPLIDSASKMSRTFVLQRALSIEELNDNSWLSSSLIDLVFSRFARSYDSVDFLPSDFAVMLSLPSSNASELFNATDILGRKLTYDSKRPMLLLYNSKNIHWILIRVQLEPQPELQLFEPMGQPMNTKRGMSYRVVPRDVVRWLDTCCPLPDKKSWLSRSVSAITSQQQFTSFDCGVACLLYAEKCGQGEAYSKIDNSTSQKDITRFRKHLQNFVAQLQFGGPPSM